MASVKRRPVCIICYKRFESENKEDGSVPLQQNIKSTSPENEEEVPSPPLFKDGKEESSLKESGNTNHSLYRRFLLFVNQYFKLREFTDRFIACAKDAKSEDGRSAKLETFCESCGELVSEICNLYKELQTAQLFLNWRVSQMGELIKRSKIPMTNELTKELATSIAEQMNLDAVRPVSLFRQTLQDKCIMASRKGLPDVAVHKGLFPDEWKFTYSATKQFLMRLIMVFILGYSQLHTNSTSVENERGNVKVKAFCNQDSHPFGESDDLDSDWSQLAATPSNAGFDDDTNLEKEETSPKSLTTLVQAEEDGNDPIESEILPHKRIPHKIIWKKYECEQGTVIVDVTGSVGPSGSHHTVLTSAAACRLDFATNSRAYYVNSGRSTSSSPTPSSSASSDTGRQSSSIYSDSDSDSCLHFPSTIGGGVEHDTYPWSTTSIITSPTDLPSSLEEPIEHSDDTVDPRLQDEGVGGARVPKKRKKSGPIPDHITVLAGEPPMYQCNVCQKTFKTKAHINYHEFCEKGDKPFKCEQCGQGFIAKSHYEYHLRTHTGERPFNCPICGKGFNQRGKVTRHMRCHTGEKPFVCQVCHRGFANAQALRSHVLIHTGERPYACTYCIKRFTGMTNLKKHILTHTGERPFSCNHCGKSFGLKWTLDIHLRTHSNERPYACDQCSRAFSSSKDLRRHLGIHSDERPFKCWICGTAFRRKDNLYRHIKNTHNQQPT